MFKITEKYKQAIIQPSRTWKCKINHNNYNFSDEDIISIEYKNNIASSGYTLGTATSANATITFLNMNNISSNLDSSKPFYIELGLLVDDNIYEYVPLGTFYVDKYEADDYKIKLECYDIMMKFEKNIAISTDNLSVRQLVTSIASSLGVEIEDISKWSQDIINKPTKNYTARELLGYCAGISCGNAIINKQGKVDLIKVNGDIQQTVSTDNWFSKKISDTFFKVRKLIVSTESKNKITIGSGTDDETITINNPLCNNNSANNMYNFLSMLSFNGFEAKFDGNPALEMGDIIKLTDNHNNVIISPILSSKIIYKGGVVSTISCIANKKLDIANSYYNNGRYSNYIDRMNDNYNDLYEDYNYLYEDYNDLYEDYNNLNDRVTALENGKVITNNVSEYVIDTTLTGKTTKTFTLQAKTGTTITTDWGDGTTDNNTTHTYTSDGIYTIKTTSQYTPKRYNASGDIWQECLVEVVKLSEIITDGSAGFYNYVNLKKVGDILGIEKAHKMFQGCTSLKYPANVGDKIKNCEQMYYGCTNLVDVSTYRDTMEDTSSMYNGCISLEFTGDMSDNIKNAEAMFCDCTKLKKIGHLSKSLENAKSMFNGCIDLKMINKNIDLPNVIKYADYMFYGCTNLNANVYYSSSLETAQGMFRNCSSMENFRDVANLTYLSNMNSMFLGCTNATFSALTKCPPNVTDLRYCFSNCSNLQLPTDFFDNVVSSAVDASSCFRNCTSLTNRIDVKNTFNADSMFRESGATETSNIAPSYWGSMYEDCINLTTINSGMYTLMQNNPTNGRRCFRNCINIINPDTYDNLDTLYHDWMYKGIVVV